MKARFLTLALFLSLGLGAFSATAATNEPADIQKISRLISQLGSIKFSERRKASHALEAMDAPALDNLRKAAASSADMEIRSRATALVARIEKRMEAATVLAPTRVHLVCKDMCVTDAVAQLAKKARINLLLHPNSVGNLAKKRITLDTGEVTFWEALDKLCLKAGLVETTMQAVDSRLDSSIWISELPQGVLPVQPRVKNLLPQRIKGFQIRGLVPIQPANNPVAAQPIQIVIGGNNIVFSVPAQDQSQIVLCEGKPEKVATCYAGAFRIRARTAVGKNKDSAYVILEVTPEPRHLGWSLVGNPRLEKTRDERGQSLKIMLEEQVPDAQVVQWGGNVRMAQVVWHTSTLHSPTVPLKRTVQIQIKLGDKPAKLLADLAGHITVQDKTPPEDLIVVSDILKAAGKTYNGVRGGSIQVLDVRKDNNGNHQVRIKLQAPSSMDESGPAVGGIVAIQGQGRININQIGGMGGAFRPASAGAEGLSLRDAKGAAFPLIGSSMQNNNGDVTKMMTFQAQQGREPAKLVFSGQRQVNVDVPFTFKDVKLP
jgi:hypothetical protein